MNDVECPYCGHEQEVNRDDGFGCEEDMIYEMECCNCEKYFVFTASIHFYYDASKADCLNGGKHRYKKTSTVPRFATRWRCQDCGHEKPLNDGDPMLEMDRDYLLKSRGETESINS
jgi:hypothetical protein